MMIGWVGDWLGDLGGLSELHEQMNDTNLPLFGADSVLGRSIVISRASDGERWACASIGWGYAPSEARQVAAIASFHHPAGYAYGYVRLVSRYRPLPLPPPNLSLFN